ncbi:MAG: hypothetical protein ACR2RA_18675 [Geminicoccaceae bacterium]
MASGSCKKVIATTEFWTISFVQGIGLDKSPRPATSKKMRTARPSVQKAETKWIDRAKPTAAPKRHPPNRRGLHRVFLNIDANETLGTTQAHRAIDERSPPAKT